MIERRYAEQFESSAEGADGICCGSTQNLPPRR
jgi:hypothetical protein